jgi:hypothetical protein
MRWRAVFRAEIAGYIPALLENLMPKRFFPTLDDPILAGRAKLIVITSLGFMLAGWALVLTWLISGDLEGITQADPAADRSDPGGQ